MGIKFGMPLVLDSDILVFCPWRNPNGFPVHCFAHNYEANEVYFRALLQHRQKQKTMVDSPRMLYSLTFSAEIGLRMIIIGRKALFLHLLKAVLGRESETEWSGKRAGKTQMQSLVL